MVVLREDGPACSSVRSRVIRDAPADVTNGT
jgi:hypothetical protein